MALPRDFSVYDETGTNRLFFDNEYGYPNMVTVYSFLTANVPGVRYVSNTIGGTPYSDDTTMRAIYSGGVYTVYAVPFPKTIAGQIERLQYDKSCICAAIENKGVTVGNISLDGYAACIDAIQSGGTDAFVDAFVVGGGGGGGRYINCPGGGGGGGQVMTVSQQWLPGKEYCVLIGLGGGSDQNGGHTYMCDCIHNLTVIEAKGGCHGNYMGEGMGGDSGSGCIGGRSQWCNNGSGGGGAGGNGTGPSGKYSGGTGGAGLCGMGGGGGGGGRNGGGSGSTGGGNGGRNCSSGGVGCNATTYGSGGGGGGGGYSGGSGCQGLMEICYLIDGSCGFSSATGGQCCYTCNGYCVHRFTSDGTFTITS